MGIVLRSSIGARRVLWKATIVLGSMVLLLSDVVEPRNRLEGFCLMVNGPRHEEVENPSVSDPECWVRGPGRRWIHTDRQTGE